MPKQHKSGGSKKKLRSARNQRSGKYERQRLRTEANKKKRERLRKELFNMVLYKYAKSTATQVSTPRVS